MTPTPSKLRVYEALHSLNQRFEQVLADLVRLQEFPFFRREALGHLQVVVEETRAWANFELVEAMHGREQEDWTRSGRLRHQWDKRYRDPDDVLIEAEQRKRELRKAAAKRRTQGGRGGSK